MRVLLIEDHPIVRAGCRRLLQARAGIEIVEANTGAAGLRLAREREPDIVILDLKLPDSSGFAVLRQLLAERPDCKVVVFSMYEDPALAARALETGAKGYITKSDDPAALIEAIEKVADGEIHLGASVAQKLALMKVRPAGDRLHGLSAREIDALELLGQGRSVAEVASHLGLSYRTAANLVAGLKAKLNAPSIAALIRLALESLPHSTQQIGDT